MSKISDISNRVRELRHRLGLSQGDFANRLGVSRNYVSMIEGGREPSRSLLQLIEMLEAKAEGGGSDGARSILKEARTRKGLSPADLAKRIGYSTGVLQAVEDGTGRASERMIERLCTELDLSKDDLMEGSDHPLMLGETQGTYGAKPSIVTTPSVGAARYVPLISMAAAGVMSGKAFTDGSYAYEGALAFDVSDQRAFAVKIVGDSMQPNFAPGDVAIVYPSKSPRNGNCVLARLKDEAGGDVLFKLFSARGDSVILSSYNPAYPSMEYHLQDFVWIYPVAAVTKTLIT